MGLLWKHVSDDCSSVWIGESMSRGVSQVEADGLAWLKWQGQMVPLVAFPCAVEELERIA